MPDEPEILLSSIDLTGWTLEPIDDFLLFYRISDAGKNGFEWKCFSWTRGGENGPGEDPRTNSELVVENVFNGKAYFDGLRHVWFGDSAGYFNYPDSQSIVKLMTRLSELEKQHCWACKQNGGV